MTAERAPASQAWTGSGGAAPSEGTADQLGEFAVTLRVETNQTIVSVSGDVDLISASTLRGALGALIDQGCRHLVLDLADLTFMDASGLSAIARTCAHVGVSGGVLTLRSTPSMTRRILDISGISELVRFETADPSESSLGAEHRLGDHSFAVEQGAVDLASDLVRVASRHSDTAVIDAALRLVSALASATVEGADGVSVTLERAGRLSTVASTNETVMRMDGHQYETGEGPCLAAAADGHWFHIESLAHESRWPAFVPLAIEEGIASILSTPLLAADRSVGALNIYSNTESAFGTRQQELAALFATQASGILADTGIKLADDHLSERIASALRAREVIAQAQGILIARQTLDPEAAAASLHRSARAANVPVATYAANLVESTGNELEWETTEAER